MAVSIPLSVSAQVTLNGEGNGSVSLGPLVPGVSWQPISVAVKVNPTSDTVVSVFYLYNGIAVDSNFLGGSYTGDNNSAGLSVTLWPGQVLTGVWEGGNPGATATMTLYGTQTVPGNAS